LHVRRARREAMRGTAVPGVRSRAPARRWWARDRGKPAVAVSGAQPAHGGVLFRSNGIDRA
jgi:hypothetical protein